jgi:hypothetical protein
LYDCVDGAGHVNEDVFAHSNRDASGAALVLFHNKHADAHGTIQRSATFADKRPDGSRPLRQTSLLEGLGFDTLPNEALLRCREQVSGDEHLFRVGALREGGFRVALGPFGSRIYIDWQLVAQDGRGWDALAHRLGDSGARDLESALWDLALEPVQQALREALAPRPDATPAEHRDIAVRALETVIREAARLLALGAIDPGSSAALRAALESDETAHDSPEYTASTAWRLLVAAGSAFGTTGPGASLRLFDELRLRNTIAAVARDAGADSEYSWRLAARVRARLAHDLAAADENGWARFLLDDDARFAAGLEADAMREEAPTWITEESGSTADPVAIAKPKPARKKSTAKPVDPKPAPSAKAAKPASKKAAEPGTTKRKRP